jgi:hypothetical protein
MSLKPVMPLLLGPTEDFGSSLFSVESLDYEYQANGEKAKLQAPTTKHQRRTKLQIAKICRFAAAAEDRTDYPAAATGAGGGLGVCCLEFLWCLVLGCWCFGKPGQERSEVRIVSRQGFERVVRS